MKQIQTEILINAPIEKVWAILTDLHAYAEWNPFIRKIEGNLQLDSQLTVTMKSHRKRSECDAPRGAVAPNVLL